MVETISDQTERLIEYSRRQLWSVLCILLLAYPPICAFTLTGLAVANPLPIVVESGAWLGAVTCLASLLWYDR